MEFYIQYMFISPLHSAHSAPEILLPENSVGENSRILASDEPKNSKNDQLLDVQWSIDEHCAVTFEKRPLVEELKLKMWKICRPLDFQFQFFHQGALFKC